MSQFFYAHLNTTTNFTFLTGASHPHELVYQAAALGYEAIAITDECSLAGIVKAFVAAGEAGIKLLIGSRFRLSNGMHLIAIAPNRKAYAELSGFITLARRRAEKGEYEAHFEDLRFRLQTCLIIWVAEIGKDVEKPEKIVAELVKAFKQRLWIGINRQLNAGEEVGWDYWIELSTQMGVPLVACGEALMHVQDRKPLQDVMTAIRNNLTLRQLGTRRRANAEAYLKPLEQLAHLYPESLLEQTCVIADLCEFSLAELKYQYPKELVPAGLKPIQHLKNLVEEGKRARWPDGVPPTIEDAAEKELQLIEELHYEYYFLTVYDIVLFARSKGILCQGRGSAANSVVCYALFITEIAPGQINVLFERFISKERDEPPDIDVDFEHERREEVIQYIYGKYGRERAAIAATVITYHSKSAIKDIGKALGLDETLLRHLSKSLAWWDRKDDIRRRIADTGIKTSARVLKQLFILVDQIAGMPRHLSQHTGGFIISEGRLSDLVPVENASMPERTVIQWDKEDLEAMHLLKVDVLALGILTAVRKTLDLIKTYVPGFRGLPDIPREDPATYDMLCQGETVGVFQIESRAQRAMLPRLQPRRFYDLVIQIAIVRPGPIQGNMVHPYLKRRSGIEPILYPNAVVEEVLRSTLGVPLFQEQVMRLAMVGASFTGGEADQLRRAMTNWGKNSKLLLFKDRLIEGFLKNGYTQEFADKMFEQIKGFGGYGFPESHSASFALIAYASAWLKRHHPAAFYCGILNSLPMGFYQPYQLIQDAKKSGVPVFPIDINESSYDNSLEQDAQGNMGIRLGFREIDSIDEVKARSIEVCREKRPFTSIQDLARRTGFTYGDLQLLASADALRNIAGNRHEARWRAAAVKPAAGLLELAEESTHDDLLTPPPTAQKEMLEDFATIGHTLRAHPMTFLRNDPPFQRCTLSRDLVNRRSGSFVQVAGLVVTKQRPETASGVLFITLEDEAGDINVIVWKGTQEAFRKAILTARLLYIKGTVEIVREHVARPVVHVVAGFIEDYSWQLDSLAIKSRDFR
jgi:error-prone DNA polymerase